MNTLPTDVRFPVARYAATLSEADRDIFACLTHYSPGAYANVVAWFESRRKGAA